MINHLKRSHLKTKAISIVAFLSVLIIFITLISCKKQNVKWKGSIKEEAGVLVVKNPKKPIHDEDVFGLEEDLTLGKKEGREEYIFSRVNGIDVDTEENIYVLDHLSAQIRVFDKNGEFLRAIGRKGQGPGEMQIPHFIQITFQKELAVCDAPREDFIFFSMEGKYLRRVYASKIIYPLHPIKLDSRGNLIALLVPPPPLGGIELKKFDSNLELLMTISKEEGDDSYQRREIKAFSPSLCCAVSQEDNIIWGNSERYELQVLNPEGKLIKKIIKDYDPQKITEKDKAKFKEDFLLRVSRVANALGSIGYKFIFPAFFPAFKDISIDEEGRILVETYEKIKGEENAFYFDVFDSEGKYMAKVLIKTSGQFVWQKKKLYTVEEDEEGFQMVKRYRVIWKY